MEKKNKFIYVLNHKVTHWMGELNCWSNAGKWPRPNKTWDWKIFKNYFDADDFLFKQRLKNRNVDSWSPRKVLVSKKLYDNLRFSK